MRAEAVDVRAAFAAALLWSTGGLFIKATQLSAFELSFGRSVLAGLTVAYFTRREGFRLNAVTLVASYASATREPASSAAGYEPSRIVPPRSSTPSRSRSL